MATDAADLLKGHGPDRYGNSRGALDRLFPMVHAAHFEYIDQRQAEREDQSGFSAIAAQGFPDSTCGRNAARHAGIRVSPGGSPNNSTKKEEDPLNLGGLSRALLRFVRHLKADVKIGTIRLTWERRHRGGDQAFVCKRAILMAGHRRLTVPPIPLSLNLWAALSA